MSHIFDLYLTSLEDPLQQHGENCHSRGTLKKTTKNMRRYEKKWITRRSTKIQEKTCPLESHEDSYPGLVGISKNKQQGLTMMGKRWGANQACGHTFGLHGSEQRLPNVVSCRYARTKLAKIRKNGRFRYDSAHIQRQIQRSWS